MSKSTAQNYRTLKMRPTCLNGRNSASEFHANGDEINLVHQNKVSDSARSLVAVSYKVRVCTRIYCFCLLYVYNIA